MPRFPRRVIDSRLKPQQRPTITLCRVGFEEQNDGFGGRSRRWGQVEIRCIPSMTNEVYKFVWQDFHQPDSLLSVSNLGGEPLFSIRFGDKQGYEELSEENRMIANAIEIYFHAIAGHIEGYDGTGPIPIPIPEYLKSGSSMKDHGPPCSGLA